MKKLTANKAKQILHDKEVHGHPLTDKQRKFFGAVASGYIKAQDGVQFNDDVPNWLYGAQYPKRIQDEKQREFAIKNFLFAVADDFSGDVNAAEEVLYNMNQGYGSDRVENQVLRDYYGFDYADIIPERVAKYKQEYTEAFPGNSQMMEEPEEEFKNGGWLDKYSPKAQYGDLIIPQVNPAESTGRIIKTKTGPVSATGPNKELQTVAKSNLKGAKASREVQEKEKKQRIAERKSATEAIDNNKPFTFPTGETKSWDKMDWREKAYVSGKALEQRGRFNENDESFIDEWINPLSIIGDVASGLGAAPYEARAYDSNLPYLGAVATPLIMGATGFDPLGSALKVPGKVTQSMESGLLSNTYKINPWAFKPNPENIYRGIGKGGMEDAFQYGVIRNNPNKFSTEGIRAGLENGSFRSPYFVEGKNFNIAEKYGNGYIAETPLVRNAETGELAAYPAGDNWGWTGAEKEMPLKDFKILQKDWLRGYKEVPKPITETLPPPQQAGFPNPLAIADRIIPMPLNPQRLIGASGSWMDLSPLNILPFYGEKLASEATYPNLVGFRKFGNSIQDVIERQALSPKGRTNPLGGKSAFIGEGNWAAVGSPDETYKGVFEATMNPQVEGSNIKLSKIGKRQGVVGTTKEGDVDIPLTDPGLSFNRRLPFSTRYVPIDKQKLINNQFQLATFAPHLQSLIEKYGVGLAGAAGLGALGYPGALEIYNKYTIDQPKKLWEEYKKSGMYEKGKEIDKKLGLDFLYDKKKQGGIIKAQNGIEGTMGGLTDKGFNYNGAWGGQFAVGGSLPGSVGFTYARTGSTPSEGPYAKKTMPSAENGMSYYQHGLDWKPRNISKNGSVVKDNMGYWNPDNWGKVVEIDSPDITMKGVNQPLIGISDEGDIQYMEPGKDYKFKGKKVKEYPIAKNGSQQDRNQLVKLDQLTNFTNYNKPEKGGWLSKYE